MGVVLMSKRELNRIDVLARLDGRRLTTLAAADLMRVTLRQTHRLLKRYRDGGAPTIANRRRGRPSNNRQRVLGILMREKDGYAQTKLLEGLKNPGKSLLPPEKALQLLSYDIHAEAYSAAR